ncbi:hypothetical protein Phi13:2_gp108 [Cellulophaga phage phi13:2]|uniref:Uncharacterized protein n=1 Tax=Cellulophaga phage phi13:2 TaxID=1328030 RepID=S0A5X2_9CAUD|nr:hypothetical protein Phi13:2_gp108 [Cellulophaga phage phi13:2]AGO49718.1 hypothetical protein Phi13:2_gp108 [Cellulophaga phage phi13:2]
MTKEQEKEFSELIETISKTLISTMNVLNLKTHIEMTSISDGHRYRLKFEKEKI